MAKTLVEGDARQRNRATKLMYFVILAIAIFILGFVVGRMMPSERDALPKASSPSRTAVDEGPTKILNGVPVGYAQSEVGAVAAATTFAPIMAGPTGSSDEYRAAMMTLASPKWQERSRELATNAIRFVREQYGTGGSVSFSPLRYRVDEFSEDSATIQLWGVVLASGVEVEGIQESWITATVRLSWVDSDWRVAAQSSEAGPTPELLQMKPGSDAATILNEFEEYERGPNP